MPKLLSLLLQFNRPFWLYHFAFTCLALYILISGGLTTLILVLPLKMIGYAGAVGYQTYFLPQVYFYYRNAGFTIRKLYLLSIGFDMLMFMILAIICLNFLPEKTCLK